MSARIDGPFRLSAQSDEMEVLAKYFRGFGDPTRLRILGLLRGGEKSVSELVKALRQPQPKVSNHLACLRWCGLVSSERRGKRVFYKLASRRVARIVDLTQEHMEDNERTVAGGTRVALVH